MKYLFLLCCVLVRGRVPMLAQYFVLAPLGNALGIASSKCARLPVGL
jgi:hypothetical protein